MGDSYSSIGHKKSHSGFGTTGLAGGIAQEHSPLQRENDASSLGLKHKDLVGMPWRVVFALQADGWVVRQVLHWWKKNCMPESVSGWTWKQHRVRDPEWNPKTYLGKGASQNPNSAAERLKMNNASAREAGVDHEIGAVSVGWLNCLGCPTCTPNDGLVLRKGSWRHTSAVEYVFMLTKGEEYWADGEAVKEKASENTHPRGYGLGPKNESVEFGLGIKNNSDFGGAINELTSSRNPRNFTLLAGEPYSGAHFATFPVSLILPLIKATCPKRCCPTCGQGWAPVVSRPNFTDQPRRASCKSDGQILSHGAGILTSAGQAWQDWRDANPDRILGYRSTCSCRVAESVPGIALDPFCGSGTTGEVCNMLGLRFIGIDLSMPYLRDQAAVRVEHRAIDTKVHDLPLFAGMGEA